MTTLTASGSNREVTQEEGRTQTQTKRTRTWKNHSCLVGKKVAYTACHACLLIFLVLSGRLRIRTLNHLLAFSPQALELQLRISSLRNAMGG